MLENGGRRRQRRREAPTPPDGAGPAYLLGLRGQRACVRSWRAPVPAQGGLEVGLDDGAVHENGPARVVAAAAAAHAGVFAGQRARRGRHMDVAIGLRAFGASGRARGKGPGVRLVKGARRRRVLVVLVRACGRVGRVPGAQGEREGRCSELAAVAENAVVHVAEPGLIDGLAVRDALGCAGRRGLGLFQRRGRCNGCCFGRRWRRSARRLGPRRGVCEQIEVAALAGKDDPRQRAGRNIA